MVNIIVKKMCYYCGELVEVNAARVLKYVNREPIYQCYKCFKSDRHKLTGQDEDMELKRNYYCERCRYKFKAKKPLCPYCGQVDQVSKGNLTVMDIL